MYEDLVPAVLKIEEKKNFFENALIDSFKSTDSKKHTIVKKKVTFNKLTNP